MTTVEAEPRKRGRAPGTKIEYLVMALQGQTLVMIDKVDANSGKEAVGILAAGRASGEYWAIPVRSIKRYQSENRPSLTIVK